MISRTNRFHGRNSIQRLYSGGKSVRSGALALRYAPNPKRSSYRLAVVVSKKISKSAVVRNRIRRRLYESVRILSGSFAAPCDLILVVYDLKILDTPPLALQTELAKMFKKAQLTSAEPRGRAIVEA